MHKRSLGIIAAVALTAGGVGCESAGDYEDYPPAEPSQEEFQQAIGDPVERYCSYGAVSEAQLQGCLSNVTEDEIYPLTTNAAEYSRGQILTCEADAGPFCEGPPEPDGPEY